MAARGASAAVQTEWVKAANEPAHLLELIFDAGDGGPLYFTNSYRSISWNGKVYGAQGHLLGFSGLQETSEVRITEVSVQLSAVDQTLSAKFLGIGDRWLDRRLLIYRMFFDQTTEQLMVDPVAIHDGRMDEPHVDENPDVGTSVLTVLSRDQFADFDRTAGRHTNAIEQRLWFPSDASFDMLAQSAAAQAWLMWGAARP